MMKSFRTVLDGLAELSGLSICVHDLTGFSYQTKLPMRMRMHTHSFCREQKRTRKEHCFRDDLNRANTRAGKLRRPFIKKCHAGASEIVVPILLNGEHAGTIFAGPVTLKGHKPPAGACKLPVRSSSELNRLGKMISVIAGFAAQAAETLMIQDLEVQTRSEPVRQALRLAADNYSRQLTVDEVARAVFLSPSRFAHLFSDEMKVPFHRYLTLLRIERAKSLLAGSSMRVIDVSARCGFCNQNYFAGVFKREVGKTPREFRRLQQESVDI